MHKKNLDWDRKMVNKYPILFAYHPLNPNQKTTDKLAYPISFSGIEIEEGWHPLIEDACKDFQEIIYQSQYPIYFLQIKEKFSMLRIYLDVIGETKKIYRFDDYRKADKEGQRYYLWLRIVNNIVKYYESKSANICIYCGGNVNTCKCNV